MAGGSSGDEWRRETTDSLIGGHCGGWWGPIDRLLGHGKILQQNAILWELMGQWWERITVDDGLGGRT